MKLTVDALLKPVPVMVTVVAVVDATALGFTPVTVTWASAETGLPSSSATTAPANTTLFASKLKRNDGSNMIGFLPKNERKPTQPSAKRCGRFLRQAR
jgi:hypothetical protein